MGMHYLAPGDLLVTSKGPKGDGLYRLRDTNGDDKADKVELIGPTDGSIGEHGPHAILTGADGYIYVMYGNHSHPHVTLDPDSPCIGLDEDCLLPSFVDPRGHAVHIRAPGGTVQRLDPSLKTWTQFCGGFRNAYDMDMNAQGELFTFDSDMEWDVGLPWYRPCRIPHLIPGGDYGWRTGSRDMPFYYIGTLPSVDDVGRGSPVGVCFYYHHVYPQQFYGAFFSGDWSRGRIRVMFPQREGATYAGKSVDFVVGEPLNVTDCDVGPDGFLYFTVGGRGTNGGLYRVRYDGPPNVPASSDSPVDAIVNQPMPRSAWATEALNAKKAELGRQWSSDLIRAAREEKRPAEQRIRAVEALQILGPVPNRSLLSKLARDENAEVRGFAIYLLGTFKYTYARRVLENALTDSDLAVARRACESLVRSGLDTKTEVGKSDPLVDRLIGDMNSDDCFLRYSARLTLTRVPRALWADKVLSLDVSKSPHATMEGLLGLILTQSTPADADAIFAKLDSVSQAGISDGILLDYLRLVQLAFLRDAAHADRASFKQVLGPRLMALFPNSDIPTSRELEVDLAYMQTPGAIDAMLAYLTPDKSQEDQIDTVYALRSITTGWTPETRAKLVAWFDRGREMTGGASFEGYINDLWDATLKLLPEDELKVAEARKKADLDKRAAEALALLQKADKDKAKGASELATMSYKEMAEYLEYDPMAYNTTKPVVERGKEVFIRSKCATCHVFATIGKGGGPDLSTVVSRFRRRDILEAIMYPSKVISDQYQGLDLELNDLSSVSGMVVSEDAKTLTLINVDGERMDIAKDTIVSRKPSKASPMPEGLLNTMSLDELVALMNFLEHGADNG